jgi:hypothetical protein
VIPEIVKLSTAAVLVVDTEDVREFHTCIVDRNNWAVGAQDEGKVGVGVLDIACFSFNLPYFLDHRLLWT